VSGPTPNRLTAEQKEREVKLDNADHDADVIIIGGGLGGLVTGAILAKQEGMKVLLLEREEALGGKCFSWEHAEPTLEQFQRIMSRLGRSEVVRSEPPLAELIEKKVFKDYIFECGWHGFIGSDHSRIAYLLQTLGKEIPIVQNAGLRMWKDGDWVELRALMADWSEEEVAESMRLTREFKGMSKADADQYDQVDMKSFMESRTSSPRVREFHELLARWETGLNDPSLISAGEHLKVLSMMRHAERSFHHGGCGEPAGGFNVMTRAFAEIITDNGGGIRLNHKVEEVIIDEYAVKGVRVNSPDGEVRFNAAKVVCNIPMTRVHGVVPKQYWPETSNEQIAKIFPISGMLGWVCTKRPFDREFTGIYVNPCLDGCSTEDGFRGNVLFSFEDAAVVDPGRVPKGQGLMGIWAAMLPRDPDELNDEEKFSHVVDRAFEFMREFFPGFDDELEWYFVTRTNELWSHSISPGLVGNRRIPVAHPLVENLYFTGDSVEQWSFGMSGTVGAGVNCASAVSGVDQSALLPDFMR
jgi:phytoene dehydrogenase-like protein